MTQTISLPARNRTNRDGSADRRYNLGATSVRWFTFTDATGATVANVEANTARGAAGRLAVHLGVTIATVDATYTVKES